jgi:cardiolipin synthase A/B
MNDIASQRSEPAQASASSTTLRLADLALARAAGAPPTEGNDVRLLRDAAQNFPAWKEALARARRSILFEMYIFANDTTGREFAEILAERARAGVRVFVLVDWLGSWRDLHVWAPVRAAGGIVRVFNPPHLSSPMGWLVRDHRKSIVVDGEVAFVSGLCVSDRWLGNREHRLEPWRDTGIVLRGPAIRAIERAFADVYATCGDPLEDDVIGRTEPDPAGDVRVHVIANAPNVAGTFRVDLLVAAIARRNLWLTDAYFVGTSAYVQALCSAARDGVDVRLLVPGSSDIPALSPLSRAQYRPLLEGGVRVFEWGGTMLHAKTAVADGRWARVGSTNLNLASWMSNYELDAAIDDRGFAEQLAGMYLEDLERSTEIVLTRNRVRRAEPLPASPMLGELPARSRRAATGSAGRAAAGAVSVGSALGAALTNRRVLGPAEAGLLFSMAVVAGLIGVVAALWPRVLAWPIALLLMWMGIAWAVKGYQIRRHRSGVPRAEPIARVEEPARKID